MLVTLYEIGELYFRLLDTSGFHVKADDERFTASWSSEPQMSRRHLEDNVKNLHQKVCRMCSTVILPHSTNQIVGL